MDWNAVVIAINTIINDIRKEQVLQNDAIRDDIFSILEKNCTVLYYPLQNEKNRGFHVKRIVNDKLEDFVFINTDKSIDEQIFAAAHEFGHIVDVAHRVCEKLGESYPIENKLEEDITDRFAAELLMPKEAVLAMCIEHMKELNIKASSVRFEQLIKLIVMLMNDFMVPYEAVRKRMNEVGIIDDNISNQIVLEQEQVALFVDIFTRDQNSYIGNGTGIKTIQGIRSMVEVAEKEGKANGYLIARLKHDFDIGDMPSVNQVMEIRVGDSADE